MTILGENGISDINIAKALRHALRNKLTRIITFSIVNRTRIDQIAIGCVKVISIITGYTN